MARRILDEPGNVYKVRGFGLVVIFDYSYESNEVEFISSKGHNIEMSIDDFMELDPMNVTDTI